MEKKRKTLHRVLSLALSLALVISSAVSARAAFFDRDNDSYYYDYYDYLYDYDYYNDYGYYTTYYYDGVYYDYYNYNTYYLGEPLYVVASPNRAVVNVNETFNCSAYAGGGSTLGTSWGYGITYYSTGYSYTWHSDNTNVVSLSSNSGSSITATGRSAGSANITVSVSDGLGNVAYSTINVTVNGSNRPSSTVYNTSDSAEAGKRISMSSIASSISNQFSRDMGESLGSSATVQFNTVNTSVGSIRSNGAMISSSTNYSYSTVSNMEFDAAAKGTFTTTYTAYQNGRSISGTITINVTGGVGVTSAAITPASIEMSPYSSKYINLSVTPANANYTVSWSSSDTSVATAKGTGATATLETSKSGKATITATVTDANGSKKTATCTVNVESSATYNPSLALSIGSDYHGTDTSESMALQFKDVFGSELNLDTATISFGSMGSAQVGTLKLDGAAVTAGKTYTFKDWINMNFEPAAAGTYSLPYTLNCDEHTLSGTLEISVLTPKISAELSSTSMKLASFSDTLLNVTVTPATERYSVVWYSSNPAIATVSGNGSSVRVSAKGTEGTADIYCGIADSEGVVLTKRCTVTVERSASYNPTVSTKLGTSYTGTGTSEAMAKEFLSVFGTELNYPNAKIRFSSTGNGVGVMRLANGDPIAANTDYTFDQYVTMYTDPSAAGNFVIPYTLTDGDKSLSGNVTVSISAGEMDVTVLLNSTAAYTFSQAAAGGQSGAAILSGALTNAIGDDWKDVVFGAASGTAGTLYANDALTAVAGASMDADGMAKLYFVPSASGVVTVPFSARNDAGEAVATGRLNIKVNANAAELLTDVKTTDWFHDAVVWALNQGITYGYKGSEANLFKPLEACSTGEILTFLWRSNGSPVSAVSNPFSDVTDADPYYQAALWASEKGLVSGSTLKGASPCTRSEAVTYMWKLAGSPTAPSAGFSDLSSGTDIASAANWAYAQGIVVGTGYDGMGSPLFSPDLTCNRATIITLLYRASND